MLVSLSFYCAFSASLLLSFPFVVSFPFDVGVSDFIDAEECTKREPHALPILVLASCFSAFRSPDSDETYVLICTQLCHLEFHILAECRRLSILAYLSSDSHNIFLQLTHPISGKRICNAFNPQHVPRLTLKVVNNGV